MSNEQRPDQRDSAPRDEAEVRQLLRVAGRRPEPPEEDLAEIRAVARDAWEQLVEERRERQRRRFWIPSLRTAALAATLVLVTLAAFWWTRIERQPVPGEIVATVERLSGTILLGTEPIVVASELRAGAELSTEDGGWTPSRVTLRMVDGQSVRLNERTIVRLVSNASLELIRGAIYVDSPPRVESEWQLDVVTSLGTVVEIGTQFEVRLDDAAGVLDVRVREGAVSVRREGRSVTASLGEGLTVRRDGSVSRRSVATEASAWQWMLDMAPAPAIEGQALDQFLGRASREMGWEVVYATEELERAAATILVHSSVAELRPDESIAVVLRASGLEYEVEDTVLVVSRP